MSVPSHTPEAKISNKKKREADSIIAAGHSRVGFQMRTTRLPDELRP